jgi:predicted DNA-binding transcriptional regulator AlpA
MKPAAPAYPNSVLSDPVLMIKEVAAYCRKHHKTIERLIRQGKGPATIRITEHRIGIRRSALEAWLASLEK